MRIVCLVALLSLPAGAALAQDTPTCREVRPGYMECGETHVTASVPSSFLLLSRSRARHDLPPLRRDLVSEVRRTVRGAPF
ncbi:MAG: hypothetical protein H6719_33670 [Sandaracinaceae bacterium]|nr:hypothetical protein [Sandaracinaceae bacterium]